MNGDSMLFMGLDIGTTHIKAMLINEKCEHVSLAVRNNRTVKDSAGRDVMSPLLLWDTVKDCMMSCASSEDKDGIVAISVASMAETGVPVSEDGSELYDMILWNDNRAIEMLADVQADIGGMEVYRATGLVLHHKHPLFRLLWLRKNEPGVFKKMKYWLSAADYVVWKLTGEMTTDYSLASRTMLFNVGENSWDSRLMDYCQISGVFPRVYDMGTAVGGLDEKIKTETGIKNAKVVVGGHDHLCALYMAGLGKKTEILNSMGTSEIFAGLSGKPALNEENFAIGLNQGLVKRGSYYWMAGLSSSGASVEWLRNLVSIEKTVSYDDFMPGLKKPVRSEIIYLPYLNGKAAPYIDPGGKASFVHISGSDALPDLLGAVYEGIAFQSRLILDALKKVRGLDAEKIIIVGGSAKNDVWIETKANVLDQDIWVVKPREASALGACLIAAAGVGARPAYKPDTYEVRRSDNYQAEYYRVKFQKFKELSMAL